MKKIGLLSIGILALFITSCGSNTFNVSQSTNTIELGDKVEVTQLLDYDPKDIIEIKALNEDDLDSNKLGDYDIRFEITNSKGKTQEMIFGFSVVDTQPPVLTVDENDIYIALGTEFDINNYATSSDNSNSSQIKYDDNIDTETEGVYNIEIYAVDESDNISEKENIKITVEDRRNCDIRNANFGENKETVKRYESLECVDDAGDALTYVTELSGEDAYLLYIFNDLDELYLVGYKIFENHTDYNLYISKYNEIKENVTKKYGSPDADNKNKGTLYGYCSTEAQALQLGEVNYYSVWNQERYTIELMLYQDNYEIVFLLRYTSNEINVSEDLSAY